MRDTDLPTRLLESPLYQQINDVQLRAVVNEATRKAAALLKLVPAHMKLFTLHDEVHSLNVLNWMGRLLNEFQPRPLKLSELEAALCILAAYTHDLGMTVSAEEMQDDPLYRKHRDRFPDQCRQIEARKSTDLWAAHAIEYHLYSDYLRTTHANGQAKRLRSRLAEIAKDCRFSYNNVSFQEELTLIGISHNQRTEWLRRQFIEKAPNSSSSEPWRVVRGGHPVNFALIGVLLRLADIMDFDTSRTPPILFKHLGLDTELSNSFQSKSAEEWRKHLAIDSDYYDGSRIVWSAPECPSPVVEKSIRSFIGWIQEELRNARTELSIICGRADRDRLRIQLPEADCDIIPLRISDRAAYTYRDWRFEIEHDDIVKLLMGESLYGDPGLCIRELLQNSLDALELRDLRHQLKEKGGMPAKPVDGELIRPKVIKWEGAEKELSVTVELGAQDGREFLVVVDNGTGMDEDTIQRYFTRLGRSFYKSPSFLEEQAEMRRHGLLLSPISQFGIGILSCFMIADSIEIRTNPGGGMASALDLSVSGPGNLFWTRPGTRREQGTEVRLWLQTKFATLLRSSRHISGLGLPGGVSDEVQRDLERLATKSTGALDPVRAILRNVVWPLYPIRLNPENKPNLRIDEGLHKMRTESRVRHSEFLKRLGQWGYDKAGVSSLSWEFVNWNDDVGPEATGTRIRVWHPAFSQQPRNCWQWMQIIDEIDQGIDRPTCLILAKSIYFESGNFYERSLGVEQFERFRSGPGCRIWIDLRGSLCPKLTVDRRRAYFPEDDPTEWLQALDGLYSRFSRDSRWHSAAALLAWQEWDDSMRAAIAERLEPPLEFNGAEFFRDERNRRLALTSLLRFTSRRDADLALYSPEEWDGRKSSGRERLGAKDVSLGGFPALLRQRLNQFDEADMTLAYLVEDLEAAELDRSDSKSIGYANLISLGAPEAACEIEFLQEAFWPSLEESWPPLGLQGLVGAVGDAILTAPGRCRFDLDGRKVLFSDQLGTQPALLHRYEFDLCLPLTGIPLGRLRKNFPKWREEREYRPFGVAPFLLPELARTLSVCAKELVELFQPITCIHAFLPDQSLWDKLFEDWTDEDWDHENHKTMMWDIESGTVYSARGVIHRDNMRTTGTAIRVG